MKYAILFLAGVLLLVGFTYGPNPADSISATTTTTKYVVNTDLYSSPAVPTMSYIKAVDGDLVGAGHSWDSVSGWSAVTDTFTISQGDIIPISGSIDILTIRSVAGTVDTKVYTYRE